MWKQIELFIAHQFPDMISTIAVIVFMVIVMFSLNIWLALACILPIIVGFVVQFSFMFGSKAKEGSRNTTMQWKISTHHRFNMCGVCPQSKFLVRLCALSENSMMILLPTVI